MLSFGGTGASTDFRGVSRQLPATAVIDNSTTATVFFRINSKTDVPNHSIGLGDRATTTTVDFGDLETQLRVKQGTTAGTFALDARSGGSFTSTLASGLALNSWYNIWMVVNQATDKYDLYMNSGTGAATAANKLNSSPLSFRNGTTSDLNYFLALAGSAPVDNGVRIDDLVYLSGIDLTNPAAGFDPGAPLDARDAHRQWRLFAKCDGSVAAKPPRHDPLRRAARAGKRQHRRDAGRFLRRGRSYAARRRHIQDSRFRIGQRRVHLDVAADAAFRAGPGTRAICSAPAFLKVQLLGDYNGNGTVDAADYNVWRDSLGQSGFGLAADGSGNGIMDEDDFVIWTSNFGSSAGSGGFAGNDRARAIERVLAVAMLFAFVARALRDSRIAEFCPRLSHDMACRVAATQHSDS